MVDEKVIECLREAEVDYEILKTEPVYTCEAAAEATGTRLHQHVKSMLLLCDECKPVLALLQGDKRVDLNRVRKVTSSRRVRLASHEEVKNIMKVEIGAVSPLIADEIPILLDIGLMREKTLYMSAGTHTECVAMSPRDLLKVVKVKMTRISC